MILHVLLVFHAHPLPFESTMCTLGTGKKPSTTVDEIIFVAGSGREWPQMVTFPRQAQAMVDR